MILPFECRVSSKGNQCRFFVMWEVEIWKEKEKTHKMDGQEASTGSLTKQERRAGPGRTRSYLKAPSEWSSTSFENMKERRRERLRVKRCNDLLKLDVRSPQVSLKRWSPKATCWPHVWQVFWVARGIIFRILVFPPLFRQRPNSAHTYWEPYFWNESSKLLVFSPLFLFQAFS